MGMHTNVINMVVMDKYQSCGASVDDALKWRRTSARVDKTNGCVGLRNTVRSRAASTNMCYEVRR